MHRVDSPVHRANNFTLFAWIHRVSDKCICVMVCFFSMFVFICTATNVNSLLLHRTSAYGKHTWNAAKKQKPDDTTYEQLKSCVDPNFGNSRCTRCIKKMCIFAFFIEFKCGNTCFVRSTVKKETQTNKRTHNQIDLLFSHTWIFSVMHRIWWITTFFWCWCVAVTYTLFGFNIFWMAILKIVYFVVIYWYNFVYICAKFYSRYMHKI